jgi:hypothetical protein
VTRLRRFFRAGNLNTPIELDALPQDRHFAFAAEGLVAYAKFALCKNPLRLLPVRPAPTARAGQEGLHSQPVLHNAPCPCCCLPRWHLL